MYLNMLINELKGHTCLNYGIKVFLFLFTAKQLQVPNVSQFLFNSMYTEGNRIVCCMFRLVHKLHHLIQHEHMNYKYTLVTYN